jgi:anti-anti-sigma regulatory factor
VSGDEENSKSAPDLEEAIACLKRRFLELAPFKEDRESAEELAGEAASVLDALRVGFEAVGDDLSRPAHGEGLAMSTLLGRRAADLGLTPTAAVALGEGLAEALKSCSITLSEEHRRALTAVLLEGYCAARGDRFREGAARRARACIAPTRVAPACYSLSLRGEHTRVLVHDIADELGRALLRGEAKGCVVDLRGLVDPDPDGTAALTALLDVLGMIGCECALVAPSEEWGEALSKVRLDGAPMTIFSTYEEGLRHALDAAGLEIRKPNALRAQLRRLVKPSRG